MVKEGLDKLIYHGSRVWVYTLIGILLGSMGESLLNVMNERSHRYLSIGTGLLLLMSYFLWPLVSKNNVHVSTVISKKTSQLFFSLQKEKGWAVQMILGGLNALLPCGMVYVALAMALGYGDVLSSAFVMFGFGLGTFPMMWGLSVFRHKWSWPWVRRWPLKSASVIVCSLLLVLRGLGLGIPYLSPSEGYSEVTQGATSSCCHP